MTPPDRARLCLPPPCFARHFQNWTKKLFSHREIIFSWRAWLHFYHIKCCLEFWVPKWNLVAQSRWEVVYPAGKGRSRWHTRHRDPLLCPRAGTTPGQNLTALSSTSGYSQPGCWIGTDLEFQDCGTGENKVMWCRKRKGWISVEKSHPSCRPASFTPCLCQSERMS